jgi:hypothetical protein
MFSLRQENSFKKTNNGKTKNESSLLLHTLQPGYLAVLEGGGILNGGSETDEDVDVDATSAAADVDAGAGADVVDGGGVEEAVTGVVAGAAPATATGGGVVDADCCCVTPDV